MADPYLGVEISHEDFSERFMWTLDPGGTAFHGQLFPGIYGVDTARHADVKQDPSVAEIVPPILKAILQQAGEQGIHADRLRVLPSVGQNDCDELDVRTAIAVFTGAGRMGENTRFAWYNRQIGRLIGECGEDSPLVKNYQAGAESGVPRGSFWLVRKAGSPAIEAVRTMNYRDNSGRPGQLESLAYVPYPERDPPFDPRLEAYVNFWREVFEDPHQSLSMKEALALPLTAYPTA